MVLLVSILCAPASAALPAADEAAALVRHHPDFAAAVDRIPMGEQVVEPSLGVDAGVMWELWRYHRGAHGPERALTDKGRSIFKDLDGGLAQPGRRELLDVTGLESNGDGLCTVTFEWRYDVPGLVRRFTGTEMPYPGTAELRYHGREWTVTSLRLEPRRGRLLWNRSLGPVAVHLLEEEARASVPSRTVAGPKTVTSPRGRLATIVVTDADVSVEQAGRHQAVPYVDWSGCEVSAGTLSIRGVRGDVLAEGSPRDTAPLEDLCRRMQAARDEWAVQHKDVAERGPLGVTYDRNATLPTP